MSDYLTVAEIYHMQHRLIDMFGGMHGVRDKGAVEAAVFRPQTGYYNDLSEEAAALLESLVNNHPFLDGNKRVGFAAAHTFLLLNGFDLDVSSMAAFAFVMKAITGGKFRFALLHEWISAHLVPVSA